MDNKTLKELLQEFVGYYLPIELGRSQHTIKNYSCRLTNFFKISQVVRPEDIRLETISLFRQKLVSQGKSTRTINHYLVSIKSFLKFLKLKDYRTLSADKIILANVSDGEIDFLKQEEAHSLVNTPTKPRDKALLNLLLTSGLRVGELVRLNKGHIDLTKREIRVIDGKGGKSAVVFFNEQTKDLLQNYLHSRDDFCPALFVVSSKNPRRIAVRTVQVMVKKYSGMAGIKKGTTPHSLRHAFACRLLQSGVSIFYVQQLLRHSSIQTTQRYLHATNSELRKVYNSCNS